jgi:hypothetical protein
MPALLEGGEQSRRVTQGSGVASHPLGAAILAFRHQPGTLQHGDVFLHRGKRHVVVLGQLADRGVGVHDPREDVTTCGVRERPEQLVQRVRRCPPIYNHLVVNSSTGDERST